MPNITLILAQQFLVFSIVFLLGISHMPGPRNHPTLSTITFTSSVNYWLLIGIDVKRKNIIVMIKGF